MDRCDECGFVYDDVEIAEIGERIRSLGPRYDAAIAASSATVLRRRPDPDIWSALEYACHVRDVLVVQRERLHLALETECPTFTPMGRDERVTRDRYNEQDPETTARELAGAATRLAADFTALDADQWERTGTYNYPEPAARTMTWLGRHTIHEGEHHLGDVGRVLDDGFARTPGRTRPAGAP